MLRLWLNRNRTVQTPSIQLATWWKGVCVGVQSVDRIMLCIGWNKCKSYILSSMQQVASHSVAFKMWWMFKLNKQSVTSYLPPEQLAIRYFYQNEKSALKFSTAFWLRIWSIFCAENIWSVLYRKQSSKSQHGNFKYSLNSCRHI